MTTVLFSSGPGSDGDTESGYGDLFRQWEASRWSASAIDFTRDADEWQTCFDEARRRALRWNCSLLFYAEDALARNLTALVDAVPFGEQRHVLATHQADLARHAVFFARFFHDVIGVETRDYAGALRATLPQVTSGIRGVLETLERTAADLRTNATWPALARTITIYYLVVDGMLAQTGRSLLVKHLEEAGALATFRAGLAEIDADQQRHVEFGVRALASLRRQDPGVASAVRELFFEVLPYAATVVRPPEADERFVEALGETPDTILLGAIQRLEGWLGGAGFKVLGHDGLLPFFDPELTVEERARRPLVLARAGFFSAGAEPLKPDAEAMRYLFDAVATTASPCDGICDPMTIQWVFSDAQPWFLRVEHDRVGAHPGEAEAPDVTVEASLDAWLAVTGGRERLDDAVRADRLRLNGSESALLALTRLFPVA